MFGLFKKKKSPIDQLRNKHAKLLEEAFALSKTDRTAADAKTAEAEEVMKQIEELDKK
ncbi:MAG: Lacal_2735 family protein [Bacteroidota bacterium]